MERRRFLGVCALTPIAAAISTLTGCGKRGDWPEGMIDIKWDRDTCTRCSMAISDRHFAAEVRGGPKNAAFKFDDVGCLVVWLRDKTSAMPWLTDTATRMWVADATSRETLRWLDPRKAQFIGGRTSPMGYNFAAVPYPEGGSVDFATLREHVLALGT